MRFIFGLSFVFGIIVSFVGFFLFFGWGMGDIVKYLVIKDSIVTLLIGILKVIFSGIGIIPGLIIMSVSLYLKQKGREK